MKKLLNRKIKLTLLGYIALFMLCGMTAAISELVLISSVKTEVKSVSLPTLSPTPIPTPITPVVLPVREFAGGYYEVINNYRIANGVAPLSRNIALETSANARAYRLALGLDSWSHDGAFVHIRSFYGDKAVGENLARHFSSFDGAMGGWIASPTHNSVMLEQVCEMGIGNYGTYWVVHFGIDHANSCYR